MHVLLPKEKTVVLELEYDKIKYLFKDHGYKSDFEKSFKEDRKLELSLQVETFNTTDRNKVRRMIESIEGALSFLKAQSDDLYWKSK